MNIYVTTFLFVVLICAISHQAESFTTDVPEVSTTMEPIVSVGTTTDAPVDSTTMDPSIYVSSCERSVRLWKRKKVISRHCCYMRCIVLYTFTKPKPKDGRKYCRKLRCEKITKYGPKIVKITQCRKSGPY